MLICVISADALAAATTKIAIDDRRFDWDQTRKAMVLNRFHIKAIADAYETVCREFLENK